MTPINPPGLPEPSGYSHGMLGQGRMLFVAGQVGWDGDGRVAGPGFEEQFDRALANVLTVVREAGGTPESIARLTIYVVDRSEYTSAARRIGERYRAQMGRHYPAMTLVEVKGLLDPAARVELEATALLPPA